MLQGGEARTKWMHYDINLTQTAEDVKAAEEAIQKQRLLATTLPPRYGSPPPWSASPPPPAEQTQPGGATNDIDEDSSRAQTGQPSTQEDRRSASAAGQPRCSSFKHRNRQTNSGRILEGAGDPRHVSICLLDGSNLVVGGTALGTCLSPRGNSSPRGTSSPRGSMLANSSAVAAAAAANSSRPSSVPKLQLAGLTGVSTHASAASPREAAIEPGSILSSANRRYRLHTGSNPGLREYDGMSTSLPQQLHEQQHSADGWGSPRTATNTSRQFNAHDQQQNRPLSPGRPDRLLLNSGGNTNRCSVSAAGGRVQSPRHWEAKTASMLAHDYHQQVNAVTVATGSSEDEADINVVPAAASSGDRVHTEPGNQTKGSSTGRTTSDHVHSAAADVHSGAIPLLKLAAVVSADGRPDVKHMAISSGRTRRATAPEARIPSMVPGEGVIWCLCSVGVHAGMYAIITSTTL